MFFGTMSFSGVTYELLQILWPDLRQGPYLNFVVRSCEMPLSLRLFLESLRRMSFQDVCMHIR